MSGSRRSDAAHLALAALTFAAAGGLAAGAYLRVTPPSYLATTHLLAGVENATAGSADGGSAPASMDAVTALLRSYTTLATTPDVMAAVTRTVEPTTAPQSLAERVTVVNPPGTLVVDVSVTDQRADQARRLADAVARSLSDAVATWQPATGGTTRLTLTVAAPATATAVGDLLPTDGVALGALIGAVAGAALQLAGRRRGDPRPVTSAADVTDTTGLPVVAETDDDLERATRQLAVNLRFLCVDRTVRVIAVVAADTASLRREGPAARTLRLRRSVVACIVAGALTRIGERALLVDGDFAAAGVTEVMGLPPGAGATSVLLGDVDPEAAVTRYGDGLEVLTAGPPPPNPYGLLASDRMRSLLAAVRGTGRVVVIDLPQHTLDGAPGRADDPTTTLQAVAGAVDGVLLVVTPGSVRRAELTRAADAVRESGVAVVGVVLAHDLPDRLAPQAPPEVPRPPGRHSSPASAPTRASSRRDLRAAASAPTASAPTVLTTAAPTTTEVVTLAPSAGPLFPAGPGVAQAVAHLPTQAARRSRR